MKGVSPRRDERAPRVLLSGARVAIETEPARDAQTRATESPQILGLLLAILAAHTLLWPLAASTLDGAASVHYDMLEAWVWGKELQLGYFKHPPLFAWMTSLWFEVFPRENWAFYLLAASNSALGLIGVWLLAGRVLDANARLAAVLLVLLAPFHGLLALKFNANTVLLSLFPWVAYAFVRSLETRKLAFGILFGVLAGLALLAKYFSVVLLACCFLASLLHPERRAYYRSAAPYVAVASAVIVLMPHLWWMVGHDFLTIRYAASQATLAAGQPVLKALETLARGIGAHVLIAIVLALTLGRQMSPILRAGLARLSRRPMLWLAVLIFGPFLLTVVLGLAGGFKVTSNYIIPTLSLVPISLLIAVPAPMARATLRPLFAVVAVLLAALALTWPLVRLLDLRTQAEAGKEPARALARAATKLWRDQTGKPLRLTAGSRSYALALPFYSHDAPSDFTLFSTEAAPWVTKERIAREGLLIVCVRGDLECLKKAAPLVAQDARRLELSLPMPTSRGEDGSKVRFELFIVPPR